MTRALPLITALLLTTAGCDRTDPAPANTAAPAGATVETPVAEPQGVVVIVGVAGVEPGGEPVEAALQTEAQLGTEDTNYRARVTADADAVALRFDGVAPGRYAVVAVQPTLPPKRERPITNGSADAAEAMVPARGGPNPPAALSVTGPGGWAASGTDGRVPPKWAAAGVLVGADGATVPLTLTRR